MNRTRDRIAAVLAIVLAVPQTLALAAEPEMTGLVLLRRCEGREGDAAERLVGPLLCGSYLRGLLDGYQMTSELARGDKQLMCLPRSGVSTEQSIRIATKWFKEHPKRLHESARIQVLISLMKAFPCS